MNNDYAYVARRLVELSLKDSLDAVDRAEEQRLQELYDQMITEKNF